MSPLEVIDLFAGAGGLSTGLRRAGITPVLGMDMEPAAAHAYRESSGADMIVGDVAAVSGHALAEHYTPGAVRVLSGGPPCQTFSALSRGGACPNHGHD